MSRILRFPSAVEKDPAVESRRAERSDELGAVARRWFEVVRACGDDGRELLHDGQPTICVGDVGFFLGARLPDPDRRLRQEGAPGGRVSPPVPVFPRFGG